MKPEIKALKFAVPHEEIHYISWIIDATEGLGILQTDDAKAGKITVFTPSGQEENIFGLMKALIKEGIDIEYEEEKESGEI